MKKTEGSLFTFQNVQYQASFANIDSPAKDDMQVFGKKTAVQFRIKQTATPGQFQYDLFYWLRMESC